MYIGSGVKVVVGQVPLQTNAGAFVQTASMLEPFEFASRQVQVPVAGSAGPLHDNTLFPTSQLYTC